MKRKNGAIIIFAWVIAVVTLSSAKNALNLSIHLTSFLPMDSIQKERAIFRKEYKEKLDVLESSISQTRMEIKKKKSDLQSQFNKELDGLEEDRKNLLKKLETSESEASIHWDQFTKEIQEGYDETESKVRNFFKK